MREKGAEYIALNLSPLKDRELALPIAFTLGHLDIRPLDQRATLREPFTMWSPYLSNFFTRVQRDPADVPLEQIRALVSGAPAAITDIAEPFPLRSANSVALRGLTRLGIPSEEPSHGYYGDEGPPPEVVQHDEAYFRRLIVVGDSASVPDLCLAWDLRAQRAIDWGFPLWIPPDWLDDPSVRENIRRTQASYQAGVLERDEPAPRLVSASLTPDELTNLAQKYPDLPLIAPNTPDLSNFFTPKFRTGVSNDSIVSFVNGQVEVPIPDYTRMADFHWLESIRWAARIEDYEMPSLPSIGDRRLGLASRLAVEGITGPWTVASGGPGGLLNIGVASGWQSIVGAASAVGLRASISDKGRRAVAVMNYLRDDDGLAILASRRVYELLVQMAGIVSRQAVQQAVARRTGRDPTPEELDLLVSSIQANEIAIAQIPRPHKSWSDLRQALGADADRGACERIVERLVERRILLRGFVIVCPNCGLERWYPMGRLDETMECEGCLVTSAAAVPIGQVQWRYRMNEVIAQAVDQGALPQVLALWRFVGQSVPRRLELLGGVPGVLLTPNSSSAEGSTEVDLFGILSGRAIVGECKNAGSELRQLDVDKLIMLGGKLDCSRVVLATASDFSSVPNIVEYARSTSPPMKLEVWQAEDLFDNGRAPNEYLEFVAQSLGETY